MTTPKPYSLWRHPFLNWTESFLSSLLAWLLDFKKLLGLAPRGPEALEVVQRLRTSMKKNDKIMSRNAIQAWCDACRDDLVESLIEVPFQSSILKDWNILDDVGKDTAAAPILPEMCQSRKFVNILVRFPSSLLSADQRAKWCTTANNNNEKAESGSWSIPAKELDLPSFAVEEPMLVQFHGGGLIMGEANKTELIADAARLTMASTKSKQLITVSVEYGLAPDAPFPVGVMDALSVMEYLLQPNSTSKDNGDNNSNKRRGLLHVSGESAGGNLALIAGLETHRRYPGSVIGSIQLQSPMLNPAGDTMSYFMNQNVFPSMQWLRWCWRSYLDLKEADGDGSDDSGSGDSDDNDNKVLRQGSNHRAWQEWKTKYGPAWTRLVYPTSDLSTSSSSSSSSKSLPTFFISVNKADPLLDDGIELATALRQQQNEEEEEVKVYEFNGMHCSIGAEPSTQQERYQAWSTVIFS